MKRLAALLMALMLLCGAAVAEEFEGSTVSGRTTLVQTPSGGTLQGMSLVVGQAVKAGDVLAAARVNRLYANQDGTITRVEAEDGLNSDGLAISLAPVSRFTIYCTTSGGYDAEGNDWVTIGETVYVSCTKDGTHRGQGRITSISGKEFYVELLGGEMYVGETANIYRDADCTYLTRVGKGTVLSADDEQYNVTGTVLKTYVAVGDEVSRGQLLLTWASDADLTVVSPADGIVTSLLHQNGDSLQQDEGVLEMTAYSDIWLKLVLADEDAARLSVGDAGVYTLTSDLLETEHACHVSQICDLGEGDDTRVVYLTPDEPATVLGASVTVSIMLRPAVGSDLSAQ